MPRFEYKVIPAPVRGEKAKGLKGTQARFAHALTKLMNDMGQDGWEYQRTDTLPCEERQGLTGKTTTFQNMLVFRRTLAGENVEAPVATSTLAEKRPEALAAAAVASLTVDAPEGATPAIEAAEEGNAPALGPAAVADDAQKQQNGMAAE
ncbi:DUF4177 domain-containing protein [Actibacterium lipolyticum]|uniref:DUF4177 domain-containing protein n=1 Tax=Actibacterium lipolyticum TaxID=1524263 RepID=A0A238JUS2_9RHOB|nr:DUF4177 domain-containing protein [Actibacterium lipolyticum]SMX33934.1 hypothetical protein COL8621_01128 [Actibacterium lipolyticum]